MFLALLGSNANDDISLDENEILPNPSGTSKHATKERCSTSRRKRGHLIEEAIVCFCRN